MYDVAYSQKDAYLNDTNEKECEKYLKVSTVVT
jgi:hypothetical protein